MFSISGDAFFPHTTLAERSVVGPSIIQQLEGPFASVGIVWAGKDQRINSMTLQADGTIFGKQTLEERSDATPQMIMPPFTAETHRDYGWFCWRGTDGEGQLNVGHYTRNPAPHPPYLSKSLIGEQSFSGPSLVRKDDQLYVFWTGTDPEGHLNYKELL
jgi:hypothetical protein